MDRVQAFRHAGAPAEPKGNPLTQPGPRRTAERAAGEALSPHEADRPCHAHGLSGAHMGRCKTLESGPTSAHFRRFQPFARPASARPMFTLAACVTNRNFR